MTGDTLLDTGVLIGFLDADEARHLDCVTAVEAVEGRLFTTEAVLTEAMYLLGTRVGVRGARACADFFLAAGCHLVPQSLDSLQRAIQLMERYQDVPMDFADATLVRLAEDLSVSRILTLDRDFSIYRWGGRATFELLP